MRDERGVDVSGDAFGVVRQGHGGTDDEQIYGHASADEAFTKRGKGTLEFRPVEEDIACVVHDASRSPCQSIVVTGPWG